MSELGFFNIRILIGKNQNFEKTIYGKIVQILSSQNSDVKVRHLRGTKFE